MKKLLFTLFVFLSVAASQSARAEISLSYFYDSLQDDGDWFEADGYGYCWQPNGISSDWSPYTDGYWTYTDAGWTWVSYESFGWATDHYGRWTQFRGRGWVWVPGYEWGPAWVSWRSNDDYVGWAPLPARAVVSIGFSIGRDVDYDYDIGPSNYRFTRCNDFGSPSLRPVIIDRSQNVTIVNQTTNITNITYQNNVVYNGGPNYDRINRQSRRPIERLKLDRISRPDNSRDNRFSRKQNGRLSVLAPSVVPVKNALKPKIVRANLGKVQTENGWSGVSDPKLAAKTRAKIQAENKGRKPTQVNRKESVQQALRSEARQKPVDSVAAQPALARPAKPQQKPDKREGQNPAVKATANQPITTENAKQNRGSQPAENRPANPANPKPFRKPENGKNESKPAVAQPVPRQTSPKQDAPRKNNEAAQRQQAAREQAQQRQQTESRPPAPEVVRKKTPAPQASNEQAARQRQPVNAAREQDQRQEAARRAAEQRDQSDRVRAQREQAGQQQRREQASQQRNEAVQQQRREQASQQRNEAVQQQRREQASQQRNEAVQQQRREQTVRQQREVRQPERQQQRPQVQPQPQRRENTDRSRKDDPRKKPTPDEGRN